MSMEIQTHKYKTTNWNAVGIFLVIRVTKISQDGPIVLINPVTRNGTGGNCSIQECLLDPTCLDVVAVRILSGVESVYIATHFCNAYYKVNAKINTDTIVAYHVLE